MTVVASEPTNAASGSSSFCMKRRLSPSRLSVNTIAAAAANAPPRGHADQRRIGQRIAKQALHDGAGHREQRADHGGRGDARNPDRPQHQLVARRQRIDGMLRPEAERGGQPGERNARGAHRQRDEGGARQRGEQANEQ